MGDFYFGVLEIGTAASRCWEGVTIYGVRKYEREIGLINSIFFCLLYTHNKQSTFHTKYIHSSSVDITAY